MDELETRFWFALIRDDQAELERVRQAVLSRRSALLASVSLGARRKKSSDQLTDAREARPAYA